MSRLTNNLTLSPSASIDLHMHTTYSDGRWPAQQLIDFLVAEKFDLVAVTDHDRVDKVGEIQALAAEKQLPVLAGVEMSTEWNGEVGKGRMGDMLCYGFDPEHNELAPLTTGIVQRQLENTYEVNEALRKQGYDFPRQEEVLARNDGKLRFPADNALLLREHGHAADWRGAMQMIHAAGYRSIRADMAETVEAVHKSGGVCLIAHPGRREGGFTYYDPALLDHVRAEIPLDGIEVYHPYHSKEIIEVFLEYVKQHELLASTGSDSHCIPGRMPMKYHAEINKNLLERVDITVSA
ncbi:MAG: PHP domain-containing protein [Ktedonobacteraceae bacterium]